jgi:hypothetical protein
VGIDVTKPPYNADPTGQTDSSAAFQAAIKDAQSSGKNAIALPPGTFLVNGITFGSVAMNGSGVNITKVQTENCQPNLFTSASVTNLTFVAVGWTMPVLTVQGNTSAQIYNVGFTAGSQLIVSGAGTASAPIVVNHCQFEPATTTFYSNTDPVILGASNVQVTASTFVGNAQAWKLLVAGSPQGSSSNITIGPGNQFSGGAPTNAVFSDVNTASFINNTVNTTGNTYSVGAWANQYVNPSDSSAPAGPVSNFTVSGNVINVIDTCQYPIASSGVNGTTITGNTITGVNSTSLTGTTTGISISGGQNATVTSNVLTNIISSGNNNGPSTGIAFSSCQGVTINGNTFTDAGRDISTTFQSSDSGSVKITNNHITDDAAGGTYVTAIFLGDQNASPSQLAVTIQGNTLNYTAPVGNLPANPEFIHCDLPGAGTNASGNVALPGGDFTQFYHP